MTQEERTLLIKDLSARLPYELIINFEIDTSYDTCYDSVYQTSQFDGELFEINQDGVVNVLPCGDDELLVDYINEQIDAEPLEVEYVMPYLRPMSSMTKEEEDELRLLKNALVSCDEANNEKFHGIINEIDEFYYSHYLDSHNLIPKDLALEAPEEMYRDKLNSLKK
jgi:hypothetical protein